MPLIQTAALTPGSTLPENLQIYNGLDCMVTLEVHEELQRLFKQPPEIYTFERALQAPALEMMLRGFLIDEGARRDGIRSLKDLIWQLGGAIGPGLPCNPEGTLQILADAVWNKPLNPRSPTQLQDFFYKCMQLPESWTSQKGVRKLSMGRETLEKLSIYLYARPIISCILAIRDYTKQLSVLETEVDWDGRMRTSYNIAGTETGRWSSSASAFSSGTNLQNISSKLRHIFVSDPGWKICGIDLEQAESREVGWLCGILFDDWTYLDACLSGDLHTTVCKMSWPGKAWTGDAKKDKALAEEVFYRDYSYRDMAKKLGHGSNYYGTPFTMARHAKIPVKVVQNFQNEYFKAFKGIPKWHQYVAMTLQTTGKLTTPFGRTRHFFGRSNDDTTLREAIAYSPQSATGDRLNLALWRIWKYMGTRVQLLAQVHDAVYFLYREDDNEEEVVSQALGYISTPLKAPSGRIYDVPGEAKVGWNWGNFHKDTNPLGLKKFKLGEKDTRKMLYGKDRVW